MAQFEWAESRHLPEDWTSTLKVHYVAVVLLLVPGFRSATYTVIYAAGDAQAVMPIL